MFEVTSVWPLDDKLGRVDLVNCPDDDNTIVDAARVSMDKDHTEYTDEQNARLIKYLAKHNHITPFFHPMLRFRFKMPIFVARQWFRHVVGCSRNEVSRRYVNSEPEFFNKAQWRYKADNVKQGSSEEILTMQDFVDVDGYHLDVVQMATEAYNFMLERGVCAEQARMVLPQSMYTEFIETGSLAFYARVFDLRIDAHSQKEIQEYAKALDVLIRPRFPVAWEALTEK